MRKVCIFLRKLGYVGLCCVASGVILIIALIAVSVLDIPRVPSELDMLINVPPTEIYAADGSLLTRVGGRKAVPFDRIASFYLDAVLAAEDDQFYAHEGIDKPALLKAVYLAATGKNGPGGSTITQQLAKNLFFTFKKTYTRKFKEILVTFEIERRFTKREILNAYCNGIYFGNYAYGIEEAATAYFGKHAANLSLAESALLAGLPQSPSRYNPYRNPDLAIRRQRWILSRMLKLEVISQNQYTAAVNEELDFRPLYASADEGSYFLDAVMYQMEQKYGDNLIYHGGLKIYTTLDPLLQGYGVQAVQSGLLGLDKRLGLSEFNPKNKEKRADYPQASLVAVEAATGAVRALIGGRDWQASQFNRATRSQRNMGSVLKPVIYLTAIEKLHLSPASLVIDAPIEIEIAGTDPWKPVNFGPHFRGQMVLKDALRHSVNTVAARLIYAVEPEAMVETLARFGVTENVRPHYSLALGGASVPPIKMAAIAGSIANLGEVIDPFLVRRVEDSSGQILEEHLIRKRMAFDPDDAYLLVDMMKDVIDNGTGRSVKRYGFTLPAIGKTGTTNDFRDSWFIGATPRLAASVWVGFDDYRKMEDPDGHGITGASGALPIWAKFMADATEGEPPRDFAVPPGIAFKKVGLSSGRVEAEDETDIHVALKENSVVPDSTMLFFERQWYAARHPEMMDTTGVQVDTTIADTTIVDTVEVTQ